MSKEPKSKELKVPKQDTQKPKIYIKRKNITGEDQQFDPVRKLEMHKKVGEVATASNSAFTMGRERHEPSKKKIYLQPAHSSGEMKIQKIDPQQNQENSPQPNTQNKAEKQQEPKAQALVWSASIDADNPDFNLSQKLKMHKNIGKVASATTSDYTQGRERHQPNTAKIELELNFHTNTKTTIQELEGVLLNDTACTALDIKDSEVIGNNKIQLEIAANESIKMGKTYAHICIESDGMDYKLEQQFEGNQASTQEAQRILTQIVLVVELSVRPADEEIKYHSNYDISAEYDNLLEPFQEMYKSLKFAV